MSCKALNKVFGKLGEATKALQITVTKKKGKKEVEETVLNEDLTTASLVNVLDMLKDAVQSLTEFVKEDQENEDESADVNKIRIRQVEDELDEEKQKKLKGKMIITSVAKGNKDCLIKSDDQLEAGGETLIDHVRDLAWRKYSVDVLEGDILSCKRLQSGAIMLSLWNWYGSSFHQLANSIKSSKNFNCNVFFNFMLTRRRNELLFEVRELKRAKKIEKFFSDERGHITIKSGEKSQKISSLPLENNKYILKTYTIAELETLMNQWTS